MVLSIIMTHYHPTHHHKNAHVHLYCHITSWLSPQQHSVRNFINTLPDLYIHNLFHLSFFCLATHFWFRMGSFSSLLFVATTISIYPNKSGSFISFIVNSIRQFCIINTHNPIIHGFHFSLGLYHLAKVSFLTI